MSPYVDLKVEPCMYCGRPSRAKVVTVPFGFYVAVCVEHLRKIADELEDTES